MVLQIDLKNSATGPICITIINMDCELCLLGTKNRGRKVNTMRQFRPRAFALHHLPTQIWKQFSGPSPVIRKWIILGTHQSSDSSLLTALCQPCEIQRTSLSRVMQYVQPSKVHIKKQINVEKKMIVSREQVTIYFPIFI